MSNPETNQEGIAIIGMSGRFPKARNIDQFWQNLRSGVEAISTFTDEELEKDGITFPKNNSNYVKARGRLEQADYFDAAFFGINPKEAEIMDPQHRVFLECAWEGLENAGYDSEKGEGLIGVFAGMSMNTYLLSNLATNPELMDLVGQYQIMLANDKDYLPTRVSYKMNLRGPSVSIQTACSTSLVAVCVACQNLLSYQCDLALAGGVSITFPQRKGHLYQEGGIVSPDGHCRAFDARAQGTVPGEGVGVVVLKRVEDALADGDQIYAVIKGWGINNDGALKMGYSAPSEDGQAEVIAAAQALAGFEPDSIRYVVAHGTGTPLGDPIEVAGLTKAFRAGTNAKGFCALTSVKTNIGHLDAAAGIAGLINATLALHHKFIPPSLNFEKPNPKIDFANSPFFVNSRPREWEAGPTPRRAGVSSFGIGGTNAHVVLEESPRVSPSATSKLPQLLVISTKTSSALEADTTNLAAHLEAHPQLHLPDVAYTLQVGRRGFNHRRMVVCRNIKDAVEALQTPESKQVFTQTAESEKPQIVFMFPGQGTQHVNMGRELYQTQPIFREQVDLCAEMLRPVLGADIRLTLYPRPDGMEEARQKLNETFLTQPAIFIINYALAKLWMNWGVQPQAMIGHSVGEYVAACLAGVFSLKEGLGLVAARARLVQQQRPGSMLAIRLEENQVFPLLVGKLSLAAVNSPSVCVVSGPTDEIDTLRLELKSRGVASQLLQTSHAFHSVMMEPVLGPFTELVKKVTLKPPRIPYVSNLTATWITPEQAMDPDYWSGHMRQKVSFAQGMAELLKEPRRIFLEVGPGQALSALARQHPSSHAQHLVLSSLALSQSQQNDSAVLLHALGRLWLRGAVVDWNAFHVSERRCRVSLPAYPFERQRYWVSPAQALLVSQDASPLLSNGEHEPRRAPPVRTGVAQQGSVGSLSRSELIASLLVTLLGELSGLTTEQMGSSISFLEMGFDSLFLTQASQAIEQRLGVRVAFADLLERFSTVDLLADHLDKLIPAGKDLADPPTQGKVPVQAPSGALPIGVKGELEGVLAVPLTESQKELWYATQMGEKASCVFNESMAVHLRGRFDLELMRKALQHVVDRHESLRTSISPVGDEQQIFPRVKIAVPLIDLSQFDSSRRESEFKALMEEEAERVFDLSKTPLLRARVVRMEPNTHCLILVVHHLVCDGGSVLVLLEELSEFYSAERQGVPLETPPPVQFSEYARAHARRRSGPQLQADEAYWVKQFSTPPPHLELPTDRPRPSKICFDAARESKPIDESLWQDLKRLSAKQNCTFFTTLVSAYFVLLHRLNGQEDLVVGVPMAVRDGIERLVGHCVNFLPLRAHISGNPKFIDHLAQVRKTFFDAFEHQNYTFGSLIQKLNLRRNASRMPLLSATFNLARGRNKLNLADLEATLTPNPRCFTNFDLTFDIMEKETELEMLCTYNTDLFEAQTIQRWLGHFHTLLKDIAANPAGHIGEMSLLSATERNQVLVEWSKGRQVFVLDAYRQPTPVGVPGDLYTTLGASADKQTYGAEGVLPALVPHPFSNEPEAMLCRTGDRARYFPDGRIEILTASNSHLNLQGFRIEPKEIETALRTHSQVRECAVSIKRQGSADSKLVAYIVPVAGQDIPVSELRRSLKEKLPAYMVPSEFVFVDKLPLLPSDGWDGNASEDQKEAQTGAAPAMSATEKLLAEIWAEVIGLEQVGIHDNFFELGGHSVLVTQILSRVRKTFQIDLSLRAVFEAPTIAALAREIEDALVAEIEELPEQEAQQLSGKPELSLKEAG